MTVLVSKHFLFLHSAREHCQQYEVIYY